MRVSREYFEELVVRALDSIPAELAARMDNVAVVVEDESASSANRHNLLGLYSGVPLTNRTGYPSLPDRITIYQSPISRRCRTEEQMMAMVRRVVIHEVAHHFGISDARLRELGW
ncbi:MAG: metallopeptidase family protein [Acidimicrobiales bacterium]